MHILGDTKFTCNPVKNETNIRDRGLPLLAARVMFNSAMWWCTKGRQSASSPRLGGIDTAKTRERPTRSAVSSATTFCPVD